jgi:alkylhydroperoxidase family enzyme
MSRLPDLDPADAEPATTAALAGVPPLRIVQMLAHAQRAFPMWLRYNAALFDPDELDPLLRELAILQVAHLTPGGAYEWAQHAPLLLASGGTEEQLAAIAAGEAGADCLGADGRLLLAFVMQVVVDADVDDPTFAAAAERFSPREIMQILLVVGQYMAIARISSTLRLEPDDALDPEEVERARTRGGLSPRSRTADP